MKIAIAQLSPKVGDFDGNVSKIREAYERACQSQARLLLTPEMAVCGYPPHDLVERPEMFERNEKALADLAQLTQDKETALVVGYVARNPREKGKPAQNVISVLEKGQVVFTQAKTLLPTYDVFDEARYFEPASEIGSWDCDGTRVGFAICEDLWESDRYERDPISEYEKANLDLLVSISASPYYWNKREHREKLHTELAQRLSIPLLYINQVGANDEILFDGASFAATSKGRLAGRLKSFESSFAIIEVDSDRTEFVEPTPGDREDSAPEEIAVLARGLVVGVQDYFLKTGFKTAILGLSGGIDSALVAAIAVRALGAKNVLGIAMPSQHSSAHSLADAEALVQNLGMPFQVMPIKFLFSAMAKHLTDGRGDLRPLAMENLQARLRGLQLMTLANHYGALVLTTGNKSELATGYCTSYGDMVGAIAPLGDLFKTRVYELARHINAEWGAPIPESSITKPPSAELAPDQKDEDSLPPYDELDSMLEAYLEQGTALSELNYPWARDIARRVEMNEYKRRQAAPVLKVSPKAFGMGRRIPIAKRWDAE